MSQIKKKRKERLKSSKFDSCLIDITIEMFLYKIEHKLDKHRCFGGKKLNTNQESRRHGI